MKDALTPSACCSSDPLLHYLSHHRGRLALTDAHHGHRQDSRQLSHPTLRREQGLTWSVDDEQAGQLEAGLLIVGPQGLGALEQGIVRHIGGPNLLCDTPSLPILYIGAPHIVKQLGLACSRELKSSPPHSRLHSKRFGAKQKQAPPST